MLMLFAASCAAPGSDDAGAAAAESTADGSTATATSSAASSSSEASAGEASLTVAETTAGESTAGAFDVSASDELPAWREGQTPMTWIKVGASVPLDVDPEDDPAINPNYPDSAPWRNTSGGGDIFRVWDAWCGAAWDETTGTLRVHGGGHDDYAGNEVYAQRLFEDAALWELERPPTGAVGNTGVLNDQQETTAVYFDGRPRSNHSYDNLLSIDGELWLVVVAGPFSSGQISALHTFKLVSGDWQTVQTGLFPTGAMGVGGAGSAVHDTSRGRVYYWPSQNSEVSYWDIAAGTATTTPLYTAAGQQSRAIYVAELDLQVILNGSYAAQFGIYDYDRTLTDAPLQPGATGLAPSHEYSAGWWYPNGVWVPGFGGGVGAILCWHGGTGLWALTPPAAGDPSTSAWSWSRVEAAASNTVDPGEPNNNGVFGRFFYSERLKGVGLSRDADEPTYFMALE